MHDPAVPSEIRDAARGRSSSNSADGASPRSSKIEEVLSVDGAEKFRPLPMSVASLVGEEYNTPFTISSEEKRAMREGDESTRSAPTSPQRARQEARAKALSRRRHTHHLTRVHTTGDTDYLHANPTGVSAALNHDAVHASLIDDAPKSVPKDSEVAWRYAKQAEGVHAADRRVRRLTHEEMRKAKAKEEEEAKVRASDIAMLEKLAAGNPGTKPSTWLYRSGKYMPQSTPLHAMSDNH